jgi:type IV pilus assembly protein PilA
MGKMKNAPRHRLRSLGSQDGFTLVELLVVIVIVGILAAVALPQFLNQRTKGQDAEAKVYLVAAQKALEAWHVDHGTYAGAGVPDLTRIEVSLARANNLTVSGTADTFDLTIDSVSGSNGGGEFSLSRQAGGRIVRSCQNAGQGACSATNTW